MTAGTHETEKGEEGLARVENDSPPLGGGNAGIETKRPPTSGTYER